MKKKYLILLSLSGFVICLDQATKMYIHTQFKLHESTTIIENLFNITYVRNLAAAFGLFRTLPDNLREPFFLIMPPLAILVIFIMLKQAKDNETFRIWSLSAIFAGAIGNYIDRLHLGYVVDFLDFHIKREYVWPAFNVADIAIVCGVSIMLLLEVKLLLEERRQKKLDASTT